MRTRLARLVTVVAIITGSIFITAPAASAAPAPSCVGLTQWDTRGWVDYSYAKVVNGCRTPQRVRLIWSWRTDSGCIYIPVGYEWTDRRTGYAPSVTEVRAC